VRRGAPNAPELIYLRAAKIADMYTKLNASRSYVYAVARACDKGDISRRVRAKSKLLRPNTIINTFVTNSGLPCKGLCRCHTVRDRQGRGSRFGRHAMFRGERIHQRHVLQARPSPDQSDQSYADYPLGRIVRDSRLYTVGAGTQEIRRMLIGREFNEQFKVHGA
jgi:isovaleryl-CoA dehydrogenase